jgi:hypothetical protein
VHGHREHVALAAHGLDRDRGGGVVAQAAPYDRSIDVQVSRLRHRLGEGGREHGIIKTVRGEGYVLSCTVESVR